MKQSKNDSYYHSAAAQKKRVFPVWLLCLLLFAMLLLFTMTQVPAFLSRDPASLTAIQTDAAGTASADEAAEQADKSGVPSDFSGSQPASEADPAEELPTGGSVTAESAEIEIVMDAPADGSGSGVENAGVEDDSQFPGDGVSATDTENTPGKGIVSGYGIPEWGHIHRYHDGVCTVCGEAPEFYTDYLPEEFYREAEHPGTVELYEYDVKAYANNGYGTYEKAINVYLPYAYDESKQYNVLVLVHGDNSDEDSWLNDVYKSGDYSMRGRDILDNMFEKGIAEPCIVVCPRVYTPQVQGLTAGINQLRDELREFILPYVAEHYSTFAADGSLESLQKARDHFALGGLSNGALFVYEGGMRYNFDLFGSYAAFSGNGEPWNTVGIIQRTTAYKNLPINCYFTGAGTYNDWQQNYTKIGYEYFLEREPRVVEGKNAWRVDVEGMHEWKVWFTCLYNALPLLFPE